MYIPDDLTVGSLGNYYNVYRIGLKYGAFFPSIVFYQIIQIAKPVLISAFSNMKTNLSVIKKKIGQRPPRKFLLEKKIALCCPKAQHVKPHFELVFQQIMRW